ncbi:MAG: alternate ATPase, subunit gamma [Phycisphaerales bacterium]|nr:alternate ATPase, subunit gamma [Phycisphaerales bacterium]
MSDTPATLLRKIGTAGDLQSVVRTMKAVAASSAGQYEKSVLALTDYYRNVELGLGACLRNFEAVSPGTSPDTGFVESATSRTVGAIIYGSDQGLVGQFNEVVTEYAMKALLDLSGSIDRLQVWAVGERVHSSLADAGVAPLGLFSVPNSIAGISALVTEIQIDSERRRAKGQYATLYLFNKRPTSGSLFEPVGQRLLPLDRDWEAAQVNHAWPTRMPPEMIGGLASTLRTLIREYLFIMLFRACAESLASENASRLAAMQRADKNIDEQLAHLNATFHRLRQSGIDAELFDVIAGFEALSSKGKV